MPRLIRAQRVFQRVLASLAGVELPRADVDPAIDEVRIAFGLGAADGAPIPLRAGEGFYAPDLLRLLRGDASPMLAIPLPTKERPDLAPLRDEAQRALEDHWEQWPAACERLGAFVSVDREHPDIALADAARYVACASAAVDSGRFIRCRIELSGIQAFIATIASRRALKILRGRSAFLDLYIDALAHHVADACGVGAIGVPYVGGGNAELFLPPSCVETTRRELAEARAFLWQRFGPDIALASAFAEEVPGRRDDALYDALADEKSAPFGEFLSTVLDDTTGPPVGFCEVCRRERRTTSERIGDDLDVLEICASCRELERFGRDLPMAVGLRRIPAGSGDEHAALDFGFARYAIESAPGRATGVHDYAINGFVGAARRFWYANARSEEAAQLGWCARQAPGGYLALLRADVDDLGNAFRTAFASSGGELAAVTLSSRLTYYFRLFANGTVGTAASFIYAGGDDVMAVGAWDQICELAAALRTGLRAYLGFEGAATAWPELSVGIAFGSEHEPLYRLAELAADLEETAKERPGKGAIGLSLGAADPTLGGDGRLALAWAEWLRARDLAVLLLAAIAGVESNLARSFAYRLIGAGDRHAREGVLAFPSLAYAVSRVRLDRALAAEILSPTNAHLLAAIGTLISLWTRSRPSEEPRL